MHLPIEAVAASRSIGSATVAIQVTVNLRQTDYIDATGNVAMQVEQK